MYTDELPNRLSFDSIEMYVEKVSQSTCIMFKDMTNAGLVQISWINFELQIINNNIREFDPCHLP